MIHVAATNSQLYSGINFYPLSERHHSIGFRVFYRSSTREHIWFFRRSVRMKCFIFSKITRRIL